jgi:hypothetical protein
MLFHKYSIGLTYTFKNKKAIAAAAQNTRLFQEAQR